MLMRKLDLVVVFLFLSCTFLSCNDNSSTSSSSDEVSITVSGVNNNASILSISFLVTDSKGNPLVKKRVDFEMVEGDGILDVYSTLTGEDGRVGAQVKKKTTNSVTVKATVFGYNATVSKSAQFSAS